MALPPMVDSAIRAEDMMPSEASVEIPESPFVDFSGGAKVTPDGEGGALVEALADIIAEEEASVAMAHDANLAEFLDESYLSEISTDLRASFEEDMSSRCEFCRCLAKPAMRAMVLSVSGSVKHGWVMCCSGCIRRRSALSL